MTADDRPQVLRLGAGGPTQLKDTNSSRPLAVRLVLLAAAVRGAYLVVVALLAYLLPDYDTSAHLLSEHCANTWPEEAAAAQQYLPGVVWDSIFFHRIAACGYEYEQFYAFYPGLPLLVRLLRSTGLLPGPYGFPITALAVNTACFLLSVWLLTKLGQRFMQNDKVAATAVLMFIVNPASIHHSMLYTEALFTTTSWLGLYFLYCQGTSLGASLAFAASSAVRSNGLLNAGFILHEHGLRAVADLHNRQWASAVKQVLTAVLCTSVCVVPFFAYMLYSYTEFCTGVWSEAGPHQQRPWCRQTIPSAYGFVQRVYWQVGFLKYWQADQIANFLLAAPTLIISLWGAVAYAAASPHVVLTGGLLPQALLQYCFGSRGQLQQRQQDGSSSKPVRGSSTAGSSLQHRGTCSKFWVAIAGGAEYCACGRMGGAAGEEDPAAVAVKAPTIPGVAFQPLRARQRQVSGQQQQRLGQEQLDQQQLSRISQQQELTRSQQRPRVEGPSGGTGTGRDEADISSSSDKGGDKAAGCTCASNTGYYRPELAVFVVHWLVLTLVALAVMHVQVATRFLSSCAPLYWFAALLMLHQGAVLRWLLWWYCFAYMGVGAVMFINFYPWT